MIDLVHKFHLYLYLNVSISMKVMSKDDNSIDTIFDINNKIEGQSNIDPEHLISQEIFHDKLFHEACQKQTPKQLVNVVK